MHQSLYTVYGIGLNPETWGISSSKKWILQTILIIIVKRKCLFWITSFLLLKVSLSVSPTNTHNAEHFRSLSCAVLAEQTTLITLLAGFIQVVSLSLVLTLDLNLRHNP